MWRKAPLPALLAGGFVVGMLAGPGIVLLSSAAYRVVITPAAGRDTGEAVLAPQPPAASVACNRPPAPVVVVARAALAHLRAIQQRVVPVTAGDDVVGFRLAAGAFDEPSSRMHSGARQGALATFGLCEGDVIRAVAGHPLDSPDAALAAYRTVKSSSEIEVELERDGRAWRIRYLFDLT